jgi:hypothetical protein
MRRLPVLLEAVGFPRPWFAVRPSPLLVLYTPPGRVRLQREVGMSCVKGVNYEHCAVTGHLFQTRQQTLDCRHENHLRLLRTVAIYLP